MEGPNERIEDKQVAEEVAYSAKEFRDVAADVRRGDTHPEFSGSPISISQAEGLDSVASLKERMREFRSRLEKFVDEYDLPDNLKLGILEEMANKKAIVDQMIKDSSNE